MIRCRAVIGRVVSKILNVYKYSTRSHTECPEPQTLGSHRESDISAVETCVTSEISNHDVNVTNVRSVSSVLLEKGASTRQLEKLFKDNPRFTNVQCAHWERVVELLEGFGLSLNEILNVIRETPVLLGLSNEHIAANLNCLQNAGVDKIFSQIAKYPELLNLQPSEIEKRTKWLKTIFPNKDVEMIVTNCPNIFNETPQSLMMIVQYVCFRMNLDQSHVVKSNALAYSLHHIATRHEFLKRAGVYTLPNPKLNIKLYNNPSLKTMISTNDRIFAEKVAKLSYDEFLFFKRLTETKDFFKFEVDDDEPSNSSYRY